MDNELQSEGTESANQACESDSCKPCCRTTMIFRATAVVVALFGVACYGALTLKPQLVELLPLGSSQPGQSAASAGSACGLSKGSCCGSSLESSCSLSSSCSSASECASSGCAESACSKSGCSGSECSASTCEKSECSASKNCQEAGSEVSAVHAALKQAFATSEQRPDGPECGCPKSKKADEANETVVSTAATE